MEPDDGGFVFVGGALALDLVNTEVVVRGKRRDLLGELDDVGRWWRAASRRYPEALGPSLPAAATEDPSLLPSVVGLRSALRGIVEAVAVGAKVAKADLIVLNRVLRDGIEALEPADDGRMRLVHAARDDGVSAALLPIARSAAVLLADCDSARLHRCGNERCILLYYDATRSATRRWCSVGCQQRARSSHRYRARKAVAD